MTSRAEVIVSRVAAQSKWAVELATIASPAVRIEPAVLRSLRLDFLPASDPSAEADLWMSPLVQVRSAAAITLAPEVAHVLRRRLRDKPDGEEQWKRIADRIEELHAGLTPLLKLEEKVIRLCYEEASPADAIDAEMAPVVQTMRSQPDKAPVLASWALRAIPRLPEAAHRSRALWALALSGSARFGVQPLLEGDPPEGAVRLVPGLLPSDVATVSVEVRRHGATLELYLPARTARAPVSARVENGVRLDVPATNPVIVEVRDGALPATPVVLSPGQRKHLRVANPVVGLRTLRGESFDLSWREPPDEAPQPTSQSASQDFPGQVHDASVLEGGEEPPVEAPAEVVVEQSTSFEQAATPRTRAVLPQTPIDAELEEGQARFDDAPSTASRAEREAEQGEDEEDAESEAEEPEPYRIYCSYTAKDYSYAQELQVHLTPLVRGRRIVVETSDGPMDVEETPDERVHRADLFLALLSSDYMSDRWTHEESQIASKLQREGMLTVVPILVRAVSLEGTLFDGLVTLPRSQKSVATSRDRDVVWDEIVKEIRSLVLAASQAAPTPKPRRSVSRKKPPRRPAW